MLKAILSEDKESVFIERNGVRILEINEFPDESHTGDHLFLIPLSKSNIVETDYEEADWTHELLR